MSFNDYENQVKAQTPKQDKKLHNVHTSLLWSIFNQKIGGSFFYHIWEYLPSSWPYNIPHVICVMHENTVRTHNIQLNARNDKLFFYEYKYINYSFMNGQWPRYLGNGITDRK